MCCVYPSGPGCLKPLSRKVVACRAAAAATLARLDLTGRCRIVIVVVVGRWSLVIERNIERRKKELYDEGGVRYITMVIVAASYTAKLHTKGRYTMFGVNLKKT